MPPESYLTVGEFERAQKQQTALILQGLGSLQAIVRAHSTSIARVETKLDERTEAASSISKKARNTSAGWSAAVAGLLMVVVEIVKAWAK